MSEQYLILASRPRIVAGSPGFVELLANMLDDRGTSSGAAAKEIKQVTGLETQEKKLIGVAELTFRDRTERRAAMPPYI